MEFSSALSPRLQIEITKGKSRHDTSRIAWAKLPGRLGAIEIKARITDLKKSEV